MREPQPKPTDGSSSEPSEADKKRRMEEAQKHAAEERQDEGGYQ